MNEFQVGIFALLLLVGVAMIDYHVCKVLSELRAIRQSKPAQES